MAIIEVKHLTHCYQNTPVLKEINLQIENGEIFGLLGPNGAGKSTIINILVTMLKNRSGTILIDGLNLTDKQNEIRRKLGVVFQDASLDERLTVYENLYFHARLYHVPLREISKRIEMILQMIDLVDRQRELVMRLSGGMKRRLEIGRAVMHTPQLLFLDEPTVGLDPQNRKRIWEYLSLFHRQQGLTVILTTHYLEEAEICDRIAIIDNGEIIALDTPAKLKEQGGGDIITFRTDDNLAVREIIQDRFKIEASIVDDELQIQVSNGAIFLPRLFDVLGSKIMTVDVQKSSLEDVFIKLTGRELRDLGVDKIEHLKSQVKSRRLR